MEIMKAIVLGVVEGLTEFLPISSTGHLIVAQDMIGYRDTSKLFTVVIQTGAIAAVVWFYRRDLWRLVTGLLRGDGAVRKFWLIWILATIPAGIIGLLLDERIEKYAITLVVAWALILGGILMWLIETYYRIPPSKPRSQLEKITIRQAVKIGCFQALALVPGVSRSAATIMGGMLSGVDRVTATAFSFYLGIPLLLIAGAYKLFTDSTSTIQGGTPVLVVGVVVAFLTALFVVGWLLRYVSRHGFKPFAYYRILFGVFLLVLIAVGTIE